MSAGLHDHTTKVAELEHQTYTHARVNVDVLLQADSANAWRLSARALLVILMTTRAPLPRRFEEY